MLASSELILDNLMNDEDGLPNITKLKVTL